MGTTVAAESQSHSFQATIMLTTVGSVTASLLYITTSHFLY